MVPEISEFKIQKSKGASTGTQKAAMENAQRRERYGRTAALDDAATVQKPRRVSIGDALDGCASGGRSGVLCALPFDMPSIDLPERTFVFACRSVDLYRHLMKRGGPGRVLARQFLDAATSTGANEEEAQAASSSADFIAKQSLVLREARESRYWLKLFEACDIGDPELVQPLSREAGELVAIFTTIVKHARANARKPQGD